MTSLNFLIQEFSGLMRPHFSNFQPYLAIFRRNLAKNMQYWRKNPGLMSYTLHTVVYIYLTCYMYNIYYKDVTVYPAYRVRINPKVPADLFYSIKYTNKLNIGPLDGLGVMISLCPILIMLPMVDPTTLCQTLYYQLNNVKNYQLNNVVLRFIICKKSWY